MKTPPSFASTPLTPEKMQGQFVGQESTTLWGRPLSYWRNLDDQVKEKGDDFEKLLVAALIENEQLKSIINVMKMDWRSIKQVIDSRANQQDFELGKVAK